MTTMISNNQLTLDSSWKPTLARHFTAVTFSKIVTTSSTAKTLFVCSLSITYPTQTYSPRAHFIQSSNWIFDMRNTITLLLIMVPRIVCDQCGALFVVSPCWQVGSAQCPLW